MAVDSILPARRAILTRLKQEPGIANILPAENIFTSRSPVTPPWPFARYENIGPARPIVATCLDGQEIDIRIHVFAKPRQIGPIVVETGDDHACRIIGAISAALDRNRFDIDRGHMRVQWRGSSVRQDRDEADAYHGMVDFRITAMTR